MSITNHDIETRARQMGIPLVGVFSKDRLPPTRRAGGYVINMQDEKDEHGNYNPGTHWVACYIEGKKAAYFDSFGCIAPQNVQRFLAPFRPWAYVSQDIQNINSSVCGAYCLVFLYWMTRNKRLPVNKRLAAFLNRFASDPKKNATILNNLFQKIK